jgi:hypothetical protein
MNLTIDSKLREKIMRSYGGGDLTCQGLLNLLQGHVSYGAMRARNKLLAILAEARRHTNHAAHKTGSNDRTMHYTIFIDGRGYHLRIDAQGAIFQITDNQQRDLGVIPPWVPPGAKY